MRSRPRAAFVMTVSLLGSIAGCGKESTSECKPPDCHINPPPQPTPQPTPTMHTTNPPAFVDPDASPTMARPTMNPPPINLADAGAPRKSSADDRK